MTTKTLRSLLILISFSLCFMACRRPKFDISKLVEEYETKGLQVWMNRKAGSIDDKIDYLPAPFNEAHTFNAAEDTLRVLILAPALEQKQLRVIPFAMLQLRYSNTTVPYIIAYPAESHLRSMYPQDYDDFMTRYYSVKWIIETWFSNHLGLGKVKNILWDSGAVANEYIVEFLKKEPLKLE